MWEILDIGVDIFIKKSYFESTKYYCHVRRDNKVEPGIDWTPHNSFCF